MLSENKITAQKIYDDATRLMNNAHKELQQADKNGKVYRDVKHLRLACGAAYLGVLKAIDGIFLLRNISKPKRQPSIEYYHNGLTQIDKKMLNSLNVAYEVLHVCGYYDGLNDIGVIKRGFEEAQNIIHKLKQLVPN
ncbi:MAG: DUF5618 family protein [Bacteroidota bacterium]